MKSNKKIKTKGATRNKMKRKKLKIKIAYISRQKKSIWNRDCAILLAKEEEKKTLRRIVC